MRKEFITDFELYLCEKFGYKNCIHVSPTRNGFCVCVREKELYLYIRFWDYSAGTGNFPDNCIILVTCDFTKNKERNIRDLVQFFKEYAPRYDYKYIGIENNPVLNGMLQWKDVAGNAFDNQAIPLTEA